MFAKRHCQGFLSDGAPTSNERRPYWPRGQCDELKGNLTRWRTRRLGRHQPLQFLDPVLGRQWGWGASRSDPNRRSTWSLRIVGWNALRAPGTGSPTRTIPFLDQQRRRRGHAGWSQSFASVDRHAALSMTATTALGTLAAIARKQQTTETQPMSSTASWGATPYLIETAASSGFKFQSVVPVSRREPCFSSLRRLSRTDPFPTPLRPYNPRQFGPNGGHATRSLWSHRPDRRGRYGRGLQGHRHQPEAGGRH